MNSNFGSSSDSNWGSSSNSKLEAKWVQMRREDEECDEEVQVRRNKQNMAAAMAATMVCQPIEEQPQWGGSIAILGRSPLFNNLTEGKTPQLHYYINNRQYNMGYYLADEIYPKWVTLVQAIPNPRNDAEKLFTLHQEAYRKDVERAFDEYIDRESDDDQEDPNRSRRARAKIYDGPNLPFNPRTGSISINEYMRCYRMIRSRATNKYLQYDLNKEITLKIFTFSLCCTIEEVKIFLSYVLSVTITHVDRNTLPTAGDKRKFKAKACLLFNEPNPKSKL
ncbi:hypothetical protein D8674_022746 [Pyrus ussuriensis x Pyrus communis]|uniref:Uncharacterized protein n=1 Tax=Pyrus ussuriensis x Pyrus communis TaxID=2448454 RepID=A0A5N5GLC8_9ROSA|nr:hypothetical protein D8674_022746 [Pyrus ussuriensis x Pyrus communis]